MADQAIIVRNTTEVKRAIGKLDKDVRIRVSSKLQGVADKVVSIIRGKVPRRTGRARASIVSRKAARTARIAFGGTRAPYLPWLDFGGRVGRRNSVRRPFIKEGRYVYPTIRDQNQFILREVENAVKEAARSNGFKVK